MSLPSQYQFGLKQAPPKARSWVQSFTAQNQTYSSASTSTTITINIPKLGDNIWLDPQQSYLTFTITPTFTGALTLDDSAACIIQTLSVYGVQQSVLLENVSNYHALSTLIWSCTTNSVLTNYSYNVLQGYSSTAVRTGESITSGTARTYSIPLLSILGVLCEKALPMSGFVIQIVCENAATAFCGSGTAVSYAVSGVEYVGCLHELPSDLSNMLKNSCGPSLLIPCTSYRNYISTLAASTLSQTVALGVRATSLKGLYAIQRPTANLTDQTKASISSTIRNYLSTWQWRIGSSYLPGPRPINSATATFAELMKSFHQFMNGTPTAMNYTTFTADAPTGDNTTKGSYALGMDLESLSHQKSAVLLGGQSTLDLSQIWLDLVFSSNPAAAQLDVWSHFDVILSYQGGAMAVQF